MNSTSRSISVDTAIDSIGLGRFQWQLLAICGLTWAADAMEVLLMAFALPGVSASFGIAKGAPAATVLLSATFAGMLVGALFWGWLADRVGRRNVFLVTVSLGVVFGLLGAFAPNLATLVIARVLTGFALGGTLPVDYAMMAEFVPTVWRGRFLVYLESFWALGTIAVAGLAWFLSTRMPPHEAWRWLLGIAALPGIVGLLARIGVPDSPRSLLSRGHPRRARQAIERVARANKQPTDFAELATPADTQRVRIGSLFRGELARRTFLLACVWFGLSLGYYGIFSWLPSYLRTQGMDLGAVYRTTLLLALAQVPGYFLAGVARRRDRPARDGHRLSAGVGVRRLSLPRCRQPRRRTRLIGADVICAAGRLGRGVRLHTRALPHRRTNHRHGDGQQLGSARQRDLAVRRLTTGHREPDDRAHRLRGLLRPGRGVRLVHRDRDPRQAARRICGGRRPAAVDKSGGGLVCCQAAQHA